MPDLSSADHGRSPPLINIPRSYNAAFDLIQRNLRAGRGDKTAFIDDSGSCSYSDLAYRAGLFASSLRASGMERGQRILLCLHDCIEFPVCFLGAIQAGIVPVAVNTMLTHRDYEFMLADCQASVAIVAASMATMFDELRSRVPSLRMVLSHAGNSDEHSLPGFLRGGGAPCPFAETASDDMCFWLYSSGSTGNPKGTVHTHASLVYTAELYARPILGVCESDLVFSAAKLFFAYGLGNALTFPMSVGATSILMAERSTPAAVFRRLSNHRVTIFYGVPTLYAAMLASGDLPPREALTLRRCTSAGEALPEDIGRRWAGLFGVDILDGIGSTEMLHIFLSNSPGDIRYGSTGKPVPGYQLRLVDDWGHDVPLGEHGELHIKGPTSATMYWNNPEKTASTFLGPWTRSGDKYLQTQDGYYIYAGRSDDMLKVGGIYVSPAEVEAALITHPAVLEVAVVGRRDGENLMKPLAYVVLKTQSSACDSLADELKQHVKTLLAPYKYPRWVEFVNELPKTATGKIQRFKLRSQQPTDLGAA
jgi:benzoate-CoA ligase